MSGNGIPEWIEDDDAAEDMVEYRCSCGQIGGDNMMGMYDGCPKNGGKKHDSTKGVVK